MRVLQRDSTISMGASNLAISEATASNTSRWRSTCGRVCRTETVHCSSGPVAIGITPRFNIAV